MSRARAVSLIAAVVAFAAAALGVAGVTFADHAADAAWFALAVVSGLPAIVLGLAVARIRDSIVGGLLAVAGAVIIVEASVDAVSGAIADGAGLHTAAPLIAIGSGSWMALYVPWALILLVFPDGRLFGRFDRVVAWALPIIALAFAALVVVAPEPYLEPYADAPHVLGVVPWAGLAAAALLPLFLAALVSSVVSAVRRYRRSSPRERVQLRWLVLAGMTIPATLLLCWCGLLFSGRPEFVIAGLAIMNIVIPIAVATALLRIDDVDVDRVIVGVATWCVILLVLVGIVAGAASAAASLPAAGSSLIAAAATAVAILVLMQLRPWLERSIGAALFPRRARALAAIAALQSRVHTGQDRPESLETILKHALRDPALRVGYARPDAAGFLDLHGDDVPGADAVAVRLAGTRIAVLVSDPSAPPISQQVATATTTLVEMTRLRVQLATALRNAEASRERILLAGYRERRRLERDLHDGAQQRLVSLGMSLRLAQRRLDRESVDVEELIEQTIDGLTESVADLRQVAQGLRPSSLDDGLTAAIANLSNGSPLPIDLELDAGPLPDAVSTTAYFVASEALTNAVKHAGAERIAMRVVHSGGVLRVSVRDDGRGGAEVLPGGGLAGLADRVGALGGDLSVSSTPDGGTNVEAVIPCGS
ncbi:sensor histidine kinase [Agromyces sp. NPDC056965]|uniref:sensor histidine kinase n=1 Tax=Agromyces sp. NPDC056965 TaxID=3345983 RepID=UPI0036446704